MDLWEVHRELKAENGLPRAFQLVKEFSHYGFPSAHTLILN